MKQMVTRELFATRINRLKVVLCVMHDKDVAIALGISQKALAIRKMRGSFPVNELLILANQKGFDADLVLHGETARVSTACSGEEVLLKRYRAMGQEYREMLLGIAEVLVKGVKS